MKMYASTDLSTMQNDFEHPVIKYVERRFDEWIEDSHPEIAEMYFGEFEEFGGESYLSKTGAIKQAIEDTWYELQESGDKWVDLRHADLEASFQP